MKLAAFSVLVVCVSSLPIQAEPWWAYQSSHITPFKTCSIERSAGDLFKALANNGVDESYLKTTFPDFPWKSAAAAVALRPIGEAGIPREGLVQYVSGTAVLKFNYSRDLTPSIVVVAISTWSAKCSSGESNFPVLSGTLQSNERDLVGGSGSGTGSGSRGGLPGYSVSGGGHYHTVDPLVFPGGREGQQLWWAYTANATAPKTCKLERNDVELMKTLVSFGVDGMVLKDGFPNIPWQSAAAAVALRPPGEAGIPKDGFVHDNAGKPSLQFTYSKDRTPAVVVVAVDKATTGCESLESGFPLVPATLAATDITSIVQGDPSRRAGTGEIKSIDQTLIAPNGKKPK